jgi:hypothetical protein
MLKHVMTLALFFVFAAQPGWASAGDMGGIAGTITDAKTGGPIAGVHLEIASPSDLVKVTTDSHGHFAVLSLPPDDHYSLTLQKDGYYARTVSGYSVYADQTQEYDITLTPSPPPNS